MNVPIRQSSWCQHVRYGMGAAEVVKCEPSMEAREAGVADVMARTGATLVPPYNHGPVIEGQGTLALELFDQVFPRSLHRYFAANSALAAVFAVSFDDDDSGDSQTAAAAAVPTVSDIQLPVAQTYCNLSGIVHSSLQRMQCEGFVLAGIEVGQHDNYNIMDSQIRLQECALPRWAILQCSGRLVNFVWCRLRVWMQSLRPCQEAA